MNDATRNRCAAALMLLGVLFLFLGVLRGEDTVIWRKAVNVCMECIGLG